MDRSYVQQNRERQLAVNEKGYRYYRNAVERHWDPYEIDLTDDLPRVIEMTEEWGEDALIQLKGGLRAFGAGEEAVTEDLVPLAYAMEDIEDEMFLTTQMYEEAKHTDFFDRYWAEVINPAEKELGFEESSLTNFQEYDEDYNEDYFELFERNEEAQKRLLTENTPINQAKAFSHYHLVIEGILAQTGYYGLHAMYGSDDVPEYPILPGLTEGFDNIRSDEGRHVGFGMYKLKELIASGDVGVEDLNDVVNELLPLVRSITTPPDDEEERIIPEDMPGLDDDALAEYATTKHMQRMEQIVNASEDIPDVDELVKIEPVG